MESERPIRTGKVPSQQKAPTQGRQKTPVQGAPKQNRTPAPPRAPKAPPKPPDEQELRTEEVSVLREVAFSFARTTHYAMLLVFCLAWWLLTAIADLYLIIGLSPFNWDNPESFWKSRSRKEEEKARRDWRGMKTQTKIAFHMAVTIVGIAMLLLLTTGMGATAVACVTIAVLGIPVWVRCNVRVKTAERWAAHVDLGARFPTDQQLRRDERKRSQQSGGRRYGEREMVNIARHEYTDYDLLIHTIPENRAGNTEAYDIVRNRVLDAIAREYPGLRREVEEQRRRK